MAASSSDADNLFELQTPPTDGITKVKFLHQSNKCIVSSWDTTVSLHSLASDNSNDNNNNNDSNTPYTKAIKLTEYKHEAGVLDMALTPDDSTVYSVGCDFALRSFNLERSNTNNNNNSNLIGYHSQPIRCVEYYANKNLIITGSWDKTIKLWDARQPCINENNENGNGSNNKNISKALSRYTLSDKIFSMSVQKNNGNLLIVATADRQVYIYDLRNMNQIEQKRESSLKHQTRTVVCHPNNEQYVLASIEGRVAVEYLNTNKEYQNKKYAFKCHRQSVTVPNSDAASGAGGGAGESKIQTIYPVNCVAFHPIYRTFATGGGDGVVNIWDGENKKRICQFPALDTSVSSVDFNFDGTIIATAQSYTWEKGDMSGNGNSNDNSIGNNGSGVAKDTVVFRKIGDSQVKPKLKKKKSTQ